MYNTNELFSSKPFNLPKSPKPSLTASKCYPNIARVLLSWVLHISFGLFLMIPVPLFVCVREGFPLDQKTKPNDIVKFRLNMQLIASQSSLRKNESDLQV